MKSIVKFLANIILMFNSIHSACNNSIQKNALKKNSNIHLYGCRVGKQSVCLCLAMSVSHWHVSSSETLYSYSVCMMFQ